MGLSEISAAPSVTAWAEIRAQSEIHRRLLAQRRLDIYGDNYEHILLDLVASIYETAEVKAQLRPFAPLAVANSLLKRVVNEIARPIYARPPRRKVPSANDAYKKIARETHLNRVMNAAIRRTQAVNTVFLFVRYIAGSGMAVDIMTPAQVTVIRDPRRPTRALAIAYEKDVDTAAGPAKHWVVWDNEVHFEIDGNGYLFDGPTKHGLGRMPMVVMHLQEPIGTFWSEAMTGTDLEVAAEQVAYINALVLKLHYCQGEKGVASFGDGGEAHDQTLDGLNIIHFPSGTTLQELNLVTDPGHYLATKAEIETTVAANYGISRARLNQTRDAADDDAALQERTAELMQVAYEAEIDLFEVIKLVSQQHEDPALRLPLDATLELDFGQLGNRTDRKTQLEVRKLERNMGVRNVLDDLMEDNPEILDEDAAWRELDENMAAEAEFVRRRRALAIPEDVTVDEPGQDAADNGAMGPKVRDGEMTKDEAADQAAKGPVKKIKVSTHQRAVPGAEESDE